MQDLHARFVEILAAIERSGMGESIRTTPYLYPMLMSVHVLGIALLVGPAFVMDLRLLGLGRSVIPVSVAARYLLPVSHAGFAVVFATGVAMFMAIALAVGGSPAAPWKFGLIAIAGVNIVIFHKGIYQHVGAWDIDVDPPMSAKVAAMVSAASWTGAVFGGRFLAY